MVTEIGKTYEALVYMALAYLKDKQKISTEVFWNERPDGIYVVPDFCIGQDKDRPTHVLCVTHSKSSSNSHMKGWRNLGELCEMKVALPQAPLAIDVTFDARMKDGVRALQESSFDYTLIVEDRPYGDSLIKWVAKHSKHLPSDQVVMVSEIGKMAKSDVCLRSVIRGLAMDLSVAIDGRSLVLDSLWEMERSRKRGKAPVSRWTYLRRGFTKRLLLGDAYVNGKIRDADVRWVVELRLARKTISGVRLCDEELLWFLKTEFAARYDTVAAHYMNEGFVAQLNKVRSFRLFDCFAEYVLENLHALQTFKGMLSCLKRQHKDPNADLILEGNLKSNNVWIYNFVAALVCADRGMGQAFGYSAFELHPQGKKTFSGGMKLGDWCSRFGCEFFNRKKNFKMPPLALALVATVLSEKLAEYTGEDIMRLLPKMIEQYLNKEMEAILMAHNGFRPLVALLADKGLLTSNQEPERIRSCFAEKAHLNGAAGCTSVMRIGKVLINWQSAYDPRHSTDKRKELCGRAVGMRYSWDEKSGKFRKRSDVERLILLIDGTWTPDQLESLIRGGWDEIYYPDEIDKLKASVLGTKVEKPSKVLPKFSPKKNYEDEELPMAAAETKGYGKKR